jgi:putative PIN family toxin of toxin-antitoxin system
MISPVQSSRMASLAVIDTDVWVAGLRGSGDANRVLLGCLQGRYRPLMSPALLAEYEDVMGREHLWATSRLASFERSELLDIFLAECRWTRIYYTWRPNLRDEADNHLIELAVAGQAQYIVSRNVRHLAHGELKFPAIRILTPSQILREPL